MGNAGSGKTSLARNLARAASVPCLSLDEVAFAEGAVRRPLADSLQDARAFLGRHPAWIVEGCYAELLEPLLPHGKALIFLNPGVEACIARSRSRTWDPGKFASAEAQRENLAMLVGWIRDYETREDDYGLRRHRELFGRFPGDKEEFVEGTLEDWGRRARQILHRSGETAKMGTL